jgi:hypothetical protein
MIPTSYSDWRRCIEVDCGIALTTAFIAARIDELSDTSHFRTQQFESLYGAQHRARVLAWFQQARAELA